MKVATRLFVQCVRLSCVGLPKKVDGDQGAEVIPVVVADAQLYKDVIRTVEIVINLNRWIQKLLLVTRLLLSTKLKI